MKKWSLTALAVTLIVIISVAAYVILGNQHPNNEQNNQDKPINYTYTILHTYPHDTSAFTEGLAYSDGYLYESTGLNGNSTLRKDDLVTGEVLQQISLEPQYFGEGIALVDDKIVQLTWQSQVGFIYNKTSFKQIGQFTYTTEGWGITSDGKTLIMSDGTATLYFLNPETFERTGTIQVHDGNMSINMLNELEYVNGSVYANVWHEDRIAIINIRNGEVEGWINLEGINRNPISDYEDVLNGIAFDSVNGRLFVTGKRWPDIFEIQLVPIN
jgi:glutaminyl-peptide cyclotransferase